MTPWQRTAFRFSYWQNSVMSDTPDSANEPHPKPKKLNLEDLLPAKAAVKTSLGPLYVRHAYTSDWKHFEIDDNRKLGKAVVLQLSSRNEDKNDSGPLTEEDFEALVDADFHALVPVISKRSGWEEMPARAGLEELGNAAKIAKEQQVKLHKNMLAEMRKSIGSSYRFLGDDALEKLQGQMAGLADIRSSAMCGSQALLAALQNAPVDVLKKAALNSMNPIEKAIVVGNLKGIEAAPRRDLSLLLPPRPEDTLLGRATLESAKNSREVAQKMDALVVVVTGLNQTVIKDVLPAWVKQVETDQKGAKNAFDQAANGLWWTKWAVITSVVVTVLATWWQVSVAREIDRENTAQQKRVEAVLDKQLAAQQQLIEQQARDAAAMREAIAALKSLASAAALKK